MAEDYPEQSSPTPPETEQQRLERLRAEALAARNEATLGKYAAGKNRIGPTPGGGGANFQSSSDTLPHVKPPVPFSKRGSTG